jgi:hypothetical protein
MHSSDVYCAANALPVLHTPVDPLKGVRHGCPIGPFLFALFASDVGVASDRCRHTTGHMGIFMPLQHADHEYWVCGAQRDAH